MHPLFTSRAMGRLDARMMVNLFCIHRLAKCLHIEAAQYTLVGMNVEPVNVDMSSPIPRHLPTIYASVPESDEEGTNENVSECVCVK